MLSGLGKYFLIKTDFSMGRFWNKHLPAPHSKSSTKISDFWSSEFHIIMAAHSSLVTLGMGMTVRNLELTSCAFLKNLQQCLMMMSKTSFWSKLARVFGRLNCPLQAERNRERLLTTLFLWFLAEKNFNFHGMTSIVILSSRPIISSHLLKNQASIEWKKKWYES